MAVNYTMKWKYSRFIVLIKTISSKSRFDLSPIKQQCQTVLFYVIWSFFNQLSSLFSTFLCLVSLFSFLFHLSASLFLLYLSSRITFTFFLFLLSSLLSSSVLWSSPISCVFHILPSLSFPTSSRSHPFPSLSHIPLFLLFILSIVHHILHVCVCSWKPREWRSRWCSHPDSQVCPTDTYSNLRDAAEIKMANAPNRYMEHTWRWRWRALRVFFFCDKDEVIWPFLSLSLSL